MNIFYTPTSNHLSKNIPLPRGIYIAQCFPDGELEITITGNVSNEDVYLIGSTDSAPALLELLLLADALKNAGAKIHLIIPYFGYARQDKIKDNVSCGARVFANILTTISAKTVSIVHLHSANLHTSLQFNHLIPYHLYIPYLKDIDLLVAPDAGSLHFAQHLSFLSNKPLLTLKKNRASDLIHFFCEQSSVIKNKKIMIVDDMISSGKTILHAAEYLKQHGALSVSVLATHGIFTGDAIEEIEQSAVEKVFITDTLPQSNRSSKMNVIHINEWLKELILK